ncbi:hypothetical protein PG999_007983 [Apiospora kogelbergensis]|uniref:Uncharacterized protein n=2 Tax=Apiospora kogelbergensis TaxID=1337665 RepID=A0AAW0QUS7_9PEZI
MDLKLAKLQQDVDQMHEGVNRCEQKNTVSEENEVLRQKCHDLENRLAHVEQTNEQLRSENQNYVDNLTKLPGDHVIDQELVRKFKGLREVIYDAVIEGWYPKVKEMISSGKTRDRSILRDLVGEGPVDAIRVQNRLCNIIFETLVEYIFGQSHFGNYKSQGSLAKYLRGIEDHFEVIVPQEQYKDVAQWRMATLKCASHYKSSETTPSDEAEESLRRKIGPITQPDATADGLAQEKTHQICSAAFELELLMRKAEDTFNVEVFHGESVTGVADFVVEFGQEPGDTDDQRETIAFCSFGALLKYPIGDSDNIPFVLVKAHAVVYV